MRGSYYSVLSGINLVFWIGSRICVVPTIVF